MSATTIDCTWAQKRNHKKIEHFYGIPENRKKSRKIYVGDQGKQCCRVGRYETAVYDMYIKGLVSDNQPK